MTTTEEWNKVELLGLITGKTKGNFNRISVVSPGEKNNYDFVAQFEENPDGKLVIIKKIADTFYAIPIREILDYKDYSYGDIGSTFEFNKKIEPSKQYRITGVGKVCTMKRNLSEHFAILEKGYLEVEEIQY